MDGNGRLLWLARAGAARDALPGSDSQLTLLEAFGLIARRGDRWHSTMPMVLATPLRDRLPGLAAPLLPGLVAARGAIADVLAPQGLAGHAPAVVFGHLLDGWFWDVLRARGLLPPDALDLAHPFWRGAVWAVWPPAAGSAGLNMVQGGQAALCMVWADATIADLRRLAADPATLAVLDHPPPGPLVQLPGGPAPMIRPGDPLDRLARQAAGALADAALPVLDDLAPLLPPGIAPDTARVILGHELIWHLAARLLPAPIPAAQAAFLRLDRGFQAPRAVLGQAPQREGHGARPEPSFQRAPWPSNAPCRSSNPMRPAAT